MKFKVVLFALTIAFLSTFFFKPIDSHAADIDIMMTSAGCKTEYFLLNDLASAYQDKTGQRLRVAKTGNKKAINLMLGKKIDFAFTCKPISKLSKKLKIDKNNVSSWKSIPIAKDPIIIVSNVKNGVKDISIAQLTDIFQGKIKNWKEIGGNDLPVFTSYINPELESGSLLLFKEFTVGMKGELDKKSKKLNGPSMLGNYVAATPGGITFMPLNSYSENFGDILDINGIKPVKENILNGKYSLSATYYLTIDGRDSKAVSDFVKYCLSEEGKKVIAKNFIPYSE